MLDSGSQHSGLRSHWSVPSASWWVLGWGVLSRFRVPSWLHLLSYHSAARGLGNQCRSCSRSARITSWFSPTCRSFPRSLICPYVLLLVVSRLFCPCSCLHVTLLSLPVPLLPCAVGLIAQRSRSLFGPQTLQAGPGISTSWQDLHIVYVILCFFVRIMFLLPPHSASESFITHTLTSISRSFILYLRFGTLGLHFWHAVLKHL